MRTPSFPSRAASALALCALSVACGPTSPPAGDGSLDINLTPDAVAQDTNSNSETSPPDATSPTDASTDGPSDGSVVPLAQWVLPRNGPNGFLLPWPSDLTLGAGGFVDFHYIPNPANNPLVNNYVTLLDHRIAGFSTAGAAYFRFTVPLDPATLPSDSAASLLPASSVQIIDVTRGERVPAQWYFRTDATRYWPANTLAVAPSFGYPLRGATPYAIVVTTSARAVGGATLARDADLLAVLASSGGDTAVSLARTSHQSALAAVTRAGISRDQILSLAVFTTQDPTAEMFRSTEFLRALPAQYNPDVVDVQRSASLSNTSYTAYTGHYGPTPLFQMGTRPYSAPGSGDFVYDAQGHPTVQGMENVTFAVTIPPGTPPTNGWPVVVYAHGTGGNARSFISDRTAASLAAQGLAGFGFDQVFNGDRLPAGSSSEDFYNFTNPVTGRMNTLQASLDLVQIGRLVRRMTIPANVTGGAAVRFDPSRVMIFGHSQGSGNGPLWAAADNDQNGPGACVFSGAGGTLTITVTERISPNTRGLVAVALGISSSNPEELVALHPVLTMAQTAADASDPVNYGRFILREPRTGNSRRHVYQTQGFVDQEVPTHAIAAFAMSMGLQLVMPAPHPVPDYSLLGMPIGSFPIQSNLASGMATGALQQLDASGTSDGHFVIFNVPGASARAARFLASYVANPTAPRITDN